jgi:SAM-dependent methyltransferase
MGYLKKPELYAQSTSKFWDDDHISKGMMEAHLNPDLEAASRKHTYIDQSVAWINQLVPSTCYPKLLDLGCGPGLYAQRFFEKGYVVTAIDFSIRSITYGKEKANEKGQNIQYIYQNYLEISYSEEFDLITLIYCDFGALSHLQRKVLLEKIYAALKSGGKFIFDVFTPKNYDGESERQSWYLNEGSGFWLEDTHLCLEAHYIYEDDIQLNQYIIMDKEERINVYRIWNRCYTRNTIIEELKEVGFEKFQIFSDVSGKPYEDDTMTMCIVVEK